MTRNLFRTARSPFRMARSLQRTARWLQRMARKPQRMARSPQRIHLIDVLKLIVIKKTARYTTSPFILK
jgi:hypothetical protein